MDNHSNYTLSLLEDRLKELNPDFPSPYLEVREGKPIYLDGHFNINQLRYLADWIEEN